jgi:hypothetical protein
MSFIASCTSRARALYAFILGTLILLCGVMLLGLIHRTEKGQLSNFGSPPLLSYSKNLGDLNSYYEKYGRDLVKVRETIQKWSANHDCLTDDIEIEISYLRIRASKPKVVWEVSPHTGCSTMVILSALIDNGGGILHSFDIKDKVTMNIPKDLTKHGWKFYEGDFRTEFYLTANIPLPNYLYIDSFHSKEFADHYTEKLFPKFNRDQRLYVSLHDVYHRAFWSDNSAKRDLSIYPTWMPCEEGLAVIDWLKDQDHTCGVFTAAAARNKKHEIQFDKILNIRDKYMGLSSRTRIRGGELTKTTSTNPTLFFELNC